MSDPCANLGDPCVVENQICGAQPLQPWACSRVMYFLAASCQTCGGQGNPSWNTYVNALPFNCSAAPPELPSPSPTSITIPLWALAMATATPKPLTFNLDVAAAFAAPTSTTSTRPSTAAISSTTPTSSSQTGGNIDTQFTSPDPPSATPVTTTSISNPKAGSGSQSAANSQLETTPMVSASIKSEANTVASSTDSPASSGSSLVTSGSPLSPSSPLSSAHRNTLPIAAIIGAAVAVCLIIICLGIFIWCGRRRRHRHASPDLIATPLAIPPPAASFTNTSPTDDSDSQRNGTIRQWYLQHEHHAAQEKISNIQRQGNSTYATHGSVFSSSNTAPESNVGHRATDPDMVAQMMELTARMREIEAQMQSPWALGLSDEGPPEYSDAGS
ncbi:hypothetical protein K438DRAFT_1834500 [Mycena galopus ATCC 62051]|nr:hypothetical protein K438DRAFT_1834500 [Mycena galopus ATCC 62051]